jgi:hypothetical protein
MHQHEPAGRLPYCFWVGVTGHRELPPDPALAERMRDELRMAGASTSPLIWG